MEVHVPNAHAAQLRKTLLATMIGYSDIINGTNRTFYGVRSLRQCREILRQVFGDCARSPSAALGDVDAINTPRYPQVTARRGRTNIV